MAKTRRQCARLKRRRAATVDVPYTRGRRRRDEELNGVTPKLDMLAPENCKLLAETLSKRVGFYCINTSGTNLMLTTFLSKLDLFRIHCVEQYPAVLHETSPWTVTLNYCNIADGVNCFYVLTLLDNPPTGDPVHKFCVWQRWGRHADSENVRDQFEFFQSASAAEKCFKAHFRFETGEEFCPKCKGKNPFREPMVPSVMKTKHGPIMLARPYPDVQTHGKPCLESMGAEAVLNSYLISSMAFRENHSVPAAVPGCYAVSPIDIGDDEDLMPLGTLHIDVLSNAMSTLSRIQMHLAGLVHDEEHLKDLSSMFYSLIPHKEAVPKVINSTSVAKEKENLLNLLSMRCPEGLKFPILSLDSIISLPSLGAKSTVARVENEREEAQVRDLFLSTVRTPKDLRSRYTVRAVFAVVPLGGATTLEKVDTPVLLWHGTPIRNVPGILKTGLKGTGFPSSVWFGTAARVSLQFSRKMGDTRHFCMFLVEVSQKHCYNGFVPRSERLHIAGVPTVEDTKPFITSPISNAVCAPFNNVRVRYLVVFE